MSCSVNGFGSACCFYAKVKASAFFKERTKNCSERILVAHDEYGRNVSLYSGQAVDKHALRSVRRDNASQRIRQSARKSPFSWTSPRGVGSRGGSIFSSDLYSCI